MTTNIFDERAGRAHLISFHTIQDQIPKQEKSVRQQSKFLLYSEDFKFLDTAILGSLLVATPHTDGSDLKLSTGGNGENEGQSQGKRFSLRYVCYLLFKSAPLVRMGNLWSKKDGRTFLLWFSRSK